MPNIIEVLDTEVTLTLSDVAMVPIVSPDGSSEKTLIRKMFPTLTPKDMRSIPPHLYNRITGCGYQTVGRR